MPHLQLHGAPALVDDDGRRHVLSPREAALLAWLHLEGPSARGPLAGRLWPDGDDAKARTNLRQTLARLKRAGALLHEPDGLLQLLPTVQVLAGEGATLLGELQLDAMPELAEWLNARRDATRRDGLREGLAAARDAVAQGDLDAALAAADALLAADNAVEAAHRVRMEVFYLRGDRAAAIAAWDACREALRAAFGIAPSAATNELGRQIVAQDGAADTGRTALPRSLPAALRRPPALVGREALLQAIHQAAGLSRVLLLAGPGGIGKTRLLQELAATWPGSLSVSARPGDAVLPGELLARVVGAALERFKPALAPALADDVQRVRRGGAPEALQSAAEHRRVLQAVAQALAACQQAGLQVLLIDDLQHADEASLEALHVVLGPWWAADDAPRLLLGARADELPAAGGAVLKAVLGSGRAARFDLAPLGIAEVQTLLDTLPWAAADAPADSAALAQALHAAVGGNPAWLLEALKSLWLAGLAAWRPGQPLPVPPTLRASLRQRLQRLPDAALQLAQLAAVAQTDFSLPLATATTGHSALQLAPLLAALQDAQVFDGPRFSHDLVAEAVQASLPAALLAPLHQQVAGHLIAAQAAPARVAHHLQAAGDGHAAAPWHAEAARAARANWQLNEAAAGFEAAARGFDPQHQHAEALQAWRDAARCWLWLDHDRAAQLALSAAENLPRTQAERVQLAISRTVWLFNTRQLAAALEAAHRLLPEMAACVAALPPGDIAFGMRLLAALVAHGLPEQRVIALAKQAQTQVPEDDDARASLLVTHGGLLHWASQPLPAACELEAAWPLVLKRREPMLQLQAAAELLKVRHALGDLPGAIAIGEAALPVARQVGGYSLHEFVCRIGMMQIAAGRCAEGLRQMVAMREGLLQQEQTLRPFYMAQLAMADLSAGRLDSAADWLARHEAPGRPGHELQDQAYLLARARVDAARGEDIAAWLEALHDARYAPLASGPRLQQQVVMAALAPPPQREIEALLHTLRGTGQRALRRTAHIAAVRSALAAGDAQGAVGHAQEALALAAAVDAWSDEPASLWLAAFDAFSAADRQAEARAALQAGVAFVEAGSVQWQGPTAKADRRAWRDTHPLHRRLLQEAAEQR